MPYSALRDKKNQLIRKARDGSVFVAPFSSSPVTNLTSGSGADLAALPAGYTDLGWTSSDGSTFGRTTEVSEVKSFGAVEPTRSDVTSDVITLAVVAQETNITSLGLYTGADLSGTQAAAVTGEFQIEKPVRPGFLYYRVLGLYVDDGDDGEIYLGRVMPRARVTEFGEQQFNDGDTPVSYSVTLTGYEDASLGYSHKWIFGGPGWLSLLADMNIDQAP